PTILGSGIDAVGDLGVSRVGEGINLVNRSLHVVGEDVVLAADVAAAASDATGTEAGDSAPT
ncbi:MAG TPA: hypothetical protein VG709_02560, partial [Actinomycetota bacterium]|nr:hypothetical protein [Actinomycetota bacterium]